MTHPFDVYKLTVTRNGKFVCSTRGRDKNYLEKLGNLLCEKYNADYYKIEYMENENDTENI